MGSVFITVRAHWTVALQLFRLKIIKFLFYLRVPIRFAALLPHVVVVLGIVVVSARVIMFC